MTEKVRDYLSVDEVATRLDVSKATVINLLARDRFPNAHKIDPESLRSPWRIPVADVEAFEQKRAGNPER